MADNDQNFLGSGWSFPPNFKIDIGDENNQVGVLELVSDNVDIQQSLQVLLSTGTGERILFPDFGCDIGSFLFEDLDKNVINEIESVITNAILKYEPRIDLQQVTVTEDTNTPGLLYINIDYTISSTNSRENIVFPYYINEANTFS